MKSMYGGEERPDDEVLFYDGYLYIILRHCVEEKGDVNYYTTLVEKCISPEYDEPISLVDIAIKYPEVKMVIHESWLSGEVYRYDNYGEKEWIQTGQTRGFA